jgi:ABC-type glycerol-3-phosphate transport system substrate-binding protein
MSDTQPTNGVTRRQYLAAAGALGAAGLAGCTGGQDDEGTATPTGTPSGDGAVTIQFASDSNFESAADEIMQTLREDGGLPEYIDIEFLSGSFVTGDRLGQYQQILSAGQERPTVFMMDNGWTVPFIARGQLANLSEVLPSSIVSEVQNNYLANMVATAQDPGGDLFGIPLFADFPTIQYRKDLMREAGYSDSEFDRWATEPMTWSRFAEVISDTMDATDKTGFNWQGAAYEGLSCCDFIEFMGSHGGSYFGDFDNYFGPIGDRRGGQRHQRHPDDACVHSRIERSGGCVGLCQHLTGGGGAVQGGVLPRAIHERRCDRTAELALLDQHQRRSGRLR